MKASLHSQIHAMWMGLQAKGLNPSRFSPNGGILLDTIFGYFSKAFIIFLLGWLFFIQHVVHNIEHMWLSFHSFILF